MADRSIQHLWQEHREAERVVGEMESLLDGQKRESKWDAARRESFARIANFYESVVINHIAKEEKVFYPALEGFLPRDVGPLAVLRGEHCEITAHFARLCELGGLLALGRNETTVVEEFERVGRTIIRVTRDHIYKEDRILFPMVARFLSEERDAYLLGEMEAISAKEQATSKSGR
jgi:hemerythrin-like domain-containing protein